MSKSSAKGKPSLSAALFDQSKKQLTKTGAKTGGIAGAIVTMDDDTRKEIEKAVGTKNVSFNTSLFVRTAQTAFAFKGAEVHAGAESMLNSTVTLVALKGFKPTDPVEAMIAAQATMLHNLAMEAGRRAQLPEQSPDVASKLRKDAANSARAMIDMIEALDRRRGKGGQQRIVVERVVVNDGGRALVAGSVVGGSALPASAPAPMALSQAAAPMAMVEAEPVPVGVGEEA